MTDSFNRRKVDTVKIENPTEGRTACSRRFIDILPPVRVYDKHGWWFSRNLVIGYVVDLEGLAGYVVS